MQDRQYIIINEDSTKLFDNFDSSLMYHWIILVLKTQPFELYWNFLTNHCIFNKRKFNF